jgi:hypothetical protein
MHAKLVVMSVVLALLSLSTASASRPAVQQTKSTNTNSTAVTFTYDLSNLEWALFAAGVATGFAEEEAKNLDNECLADSATIILNSVHGYEYFMKYVDSNQTDNVMMAYGLTFIIDAFDTYSTIDCTNIEDDYETWVDTTFGSEVVVAASPSHTVMSISDLFKGQNEPV